MFKCEKCGTTKAGEKQVRVPVIVRKVYYENVIQHDKTIVEDEESIVKSTFKKMSEANGTELVKEVIYCSKCIPEIEPEIEKEVITRQNVIAVKDNNHRG